MINDLGTENPFYSTQRLAIEALKRGHEVSYLDVEGFIYDSDEQLRGGARQAPAGIDDPEALMEAVRNDDSVHRLGVEELDVLLLRNDPADDYSHRPWAQTIGITFGNMAEERGVLVINSPTGLAKATNKLYFQTFPASVRPKTKITRDPNEAKGFVADLGGHAVIKPLHGSGGEGVFRVTPEEPNVNQIIEATLRDGYAVIQEYLPAAKDGDVRLWVVNGEPLQVNGTFAAFKRKASGDDIRSNMRGVETPAEASGNTEPAEITTDILKIAEAVGPKLKRDGMFIVGLDIAGDKLMEVNVFSPGGLWSIRKHTGVNFGPVIIEALEDHPRI